MRKETGIPISSPDAKAEKLHYKHVSAWSESSSIGLHGQGNILGPLLFLCYVNDMPISVDCKLLLYADDSALLVSNKDPKIVADRLSYELESCRQWLIDNKLSLHLGKTGNSFWFQKKAEFCSRFFRYLWWEEN